MNPRNFSFLFYIAGGVIAFMPISIVSAQNREDYYRSVASSCQSVLNSNGRIALWSDIRASAVNDTGSTSGDRYNKRVTEHCEWNLKGEKPLWNQVKDRAISSLAIPNQPYYQKRLAAHCEWSLNNTNHADWWRSIRDAAINDAGNTNSELYYKRVSEHCSWFLGQQKKPEMWNQIELSARRDVFAQ
jgi:hypothetical protein